MVSIISYRCHGIRTWIPSHNLLFRISFLRGCFFFIFELCDDFSATLNFDSDIYTNAIWAPDAALYFELPELVQRNLIRNEIQWGTTCNECIKKSHQLKWSIYNIRKIDFSNFVIHVSTGQWVSHEICLSITFYHLSIYLDLPQG